MDFQAASGMPQTNSSQRAQSSIFHQQAKAQTSLNSTVSGSNFATNQVGKENLHTQDHQMKMLSARPMTEINGSQPMVYGNMQPKTDFMQSSKTQMINLKESSHSKLSTTNSVTRQGAVLSSSDKQHLTTLKTTTKKQTQLEKIPIEQKKQMFH